MLKYFLHWSLSVPHLHLFVASHKFLKLFKWTMSTSSFVAWTLTNFIIFRRWLCPDLMVLLLADSHSNNHLYVFVWFSSRIESMSLFIMLLFLLNARSVFCTFCMIVPFILLILYFQYDEDLTGQIKLMKLVVYLVRRFILPVKYFQYCEDQTDLIKLMEPVISLIIISLVDCLRFCCLFCDHFLGNSRVTSLYSPLFD